MSVDVPPGHRAGRWLLAVLLLAVTGVGGFVAVRAGVPGHLAAAGRGVIDGVEAAWNDLGAD
jgi:hypothetical protein